MSHLHDPGVQAQRTALAWRRTGLSLLLNALLVLKGGAQRRQGVLLALGALLLLAAVLAAWFAHRRQQVLLGQGPTAQLSPPAPPLQRLALGLALIPVAWAVARFGQAFIA